MMSGKCLAIPASFFACENYTDDLSCMIVERQDPVKHLICQTNDGNSAKKRTADQ
jgi:hypothetical protein